MANRFSLRDRLCCVSPLITKSDTIKWVLENVSRLLTVLRLIYTRVRDKRCALCQLSCSASWRDGYEFFI